MKKKTKLIVSIGGLLLLIFIVFFSIIQILEPMSGKALRAEKINETPDNYVLINEQQMQQYPHLKKALNTTGYINTPTDEWKSIKNLLEEEDTIMICYHDEYYELFLIQS